MGEELVEISNDGGSWLPASVSIEFNVQILHHQLLAFEMWSLNQKRLSFLVWSF